METKQKAFQTEQELWKAFLSEEKDAFTCLFEEYADAMYAYGKKITYDSELVKDCIQDVFIKLYNNRQNLKETLSVKGYLFVALKRTLFNQLPPHSMISLEEGNEVRFEIELLSESSFEEDPAEYDDDTKAQLSKALKELSSRQREAIYLYYIQEIPLNELPALLGMNYQSTRNLIHRAMTKLRQCLGTTSSLSMSLLLLQYLSK